MSNSVPDGWSVGAISAYVKEMRSGASLSPSDFSNEGFEVIPKKAVQFGCWLVTGKKSYCTNEYASSVPRSWVNKEFVVIVLRDLVPSGPNIGLVVEIAESGDFLMAQGVYGLRLENDLNGSYFAQLSNWEWYRREMRKILVGSTQVHIRSSEFLNVLIPMPPLPEQQKIAAILSTVDDVIEKTRAQIDKLKDLKTGMMQELFTKGIGHTEFKDSPVGRIPVRWEVVQIEDVLSHIIDYRGKSPPKSEVGIPLITAKNIRQGYIDPEPREYIYHDQYDTWMVRGMPSSGDVFITTEAPLGNVARVPSYKFAIGQRVLSLCPSEKLDTDYLLYVMQSAYFREQLDLQSTGSTVAGIKQSTFRKILVALPPLQEQKKIVKPLVMLVKRTDSIAKMLEHNLRLKKALMQDLLTGKVRVKIDDKESAVA